MAASTDKSTEKKGTRLSGQSIKYMAKRVLTEFSRDGGTDQAAKLTYFMVLSIAPTLLALFSLATLLLSDLKDEIAELIKQAAASSSGASEQGLGSLVDSTVESLMGSATGGTIALIIGIATALWSASAYVKAYSRASNQIYDIPEGRGFVRQTGTMLAITLGLILSLLIIAISILLNQTLVDALLGPIASTIGAGGLLTFLTESFLPIWAWVKWPVILLFLFVILSLLYWAAPNIKKPFRLVSPGGVFAVLGIIIAAVAVSIYMATLASYSSYGAIGGIMAVLFALWVINIVIIMGAEVDAEYERAMELESGKPAEDSLTLPLRDDEGAKKQEEKYQGIVDDGRDIRLQNLHRDSDSYVSEDARLTPRAGTEGGSSVPSEGEIDPETGSLGTKGDGTSEPNGSKGA
ncbi:YihY/virulence factor BrkB family protein [Brachybacterium epidermidis]|uniref:YihY/virulence factor BrkB family protein n=1 Tax=Brachybacterium epidermidis TaxID=2781983 RepID=UPI00398F4280